MRVRDVSLAASLALVSSVTAGCESSIDHGVNQAEAVAIAEKQIHRYLPQVDTLDKNVRVSVTGEIWDVRFVSPDAGTGGAYNVKIDRKNGKVVHMSFQQ